MGKIYSQLGSHDDGHTSSKQTFRRQGDTQQNRAEKQLESAQG